MGQVKIAVIIPYYNAEDTICSVLSALGQSTEPVDIFLVNDASTSPLPDNLEVIAAPNKLTVITRIDNNAAAVLNTGFKAAFAGENYAFIAINDADDIPHADKFEKQLKYLEENPEIGMLGSWANMIDAETGQFLWVQQHPQSHDDIVEAMRFNAAFIHSSVIYRKDSLPNDSPYDESLPVAKDYAIALMMSLRTKLANLPEPLVDYYIHPKSISVKKRKKQVLVRLKLQWKYLDKSRLSSWVALCRSLILLLAPVSALKALKKLLAQNK